MRFANLCDSRHNLLQRMPEAANIFRRARHDLPSAGPERPAVVTGGENGGENGGTFSGGMKPPAGAVVR
ncbi:hypothetical protein SAMN05216266_10265 [Amycolatopsis marina]|uniref:Uncharacterized protein n=2 Tax=Amycolatopsis marina TaxID=490629 RepID=A0A1I0WLP6_9PSEU|nr:hypothetical protein SAMN05216266_10265 [Amycolatopsis marina]